MIPTADEYFRRIHQTLSLLDANNIRIFRAMKKHGPRNLQLIARETGIPYPTVFARVSRLEKSGMLRAWTNPTHSKIGLSRCMVLLSPTPGRDLLAKEALKVPSYWVRIIRCMGECNGFYSVHAVPSDNTREFEQYLEQFVPLGLASNLRVYWLDEQSSMIPNFDYYEPEKGKWKFDWNGWLQQLSDEHSRPNKSKHNHDSSEEETASFDKKDLIILKELSKDARMKLADFARMFKITLPAAKYRFDRIKEKGLINEYVMDLLPYSPEMSDMYEVRWDFKTESQMLSRTSVLEKLPFLLHYSIIHGTNSLTSRVYLPRGEMNNLITLVSSLIRRGVLSNSTFLWLDSATIQAQTFSYENWTDEKGWAYDNREYNEKLQSMLSTPDRTVKDLVAFQPMSITTTA